jgi:hypothetical protein
MEEKGMEKEENFLLYLNRELNRKNIMIKKLQQRISNLIDEKKILIEQINNLKNEIYNISISFEKNFNENKNIYYKKEKQLSDIILNFKNIFNEKETKEKNLKKELSKLNEEISNLKMINNNKDDILLLIHNFFCNIKNKLNLNYELHLDFIPYIFDKPAFIYNLKNLEKEIINKLSKDKNEDKKKKSYLSKINYKTMPMKDKNIMKKGKNFLKKKIKAKTKTNFGAKKKIYIRTPSRIKINNNINSNTYIYDNDVNSLLISNNDDNDLRKLNNTIQ